MTAAVSVDGHRHNSILPEFFEFSSSAASAKIVDMCIADDVIFHGKLLPLVADVPPQHRRSIHVSPSEDHQFDNPMSNSAAFWSGGKYSRNQRRRRVSDSELKATSPPVDPPKPKPKPKWYVLLFGSFKVPAAMEMKEIRVRQRRRSVLQPKEDMGGPWKLLRSLSCKGMEAVVVVS